MPLSPSSISCNYPIKSTEKLKNQQLSKVDTSKQQGKSQKTFFYSSFLSLSLQLAHKQSPKDLGSSLDLTQCPHPGSPLRVSRILCFVSFYLSTLTHCFGNTSHSRRFKTSWINNSPLQREKTHWIYEIPAESKKNNQDVKTERKVTPCPY